MTRNEISNIIAELYRTSPKAAFITYARIEKEIDKQGGDSNSIAWEELQAAHQAAEDAGMIVHMTVPSKSGKTMQQAFAHKDNVHLQIARGGRVN